MEPRDVREKVVRSTVHDFCRFGRPWSLCESLVEHGVDDADGTVGRDGVAAQLDATRVRDRAEKVRFSQ